MTTKTRRLLDEETTITRTTLHYNPLLSDAQYARARSLDNNIITPENKNDCRRQRRGSAPPCGGDDKYKLLLSPPSPDDGLRELVGDFGMTLFNPLACCTAPQQDAAKFR